MQNRTNLFRLATATTAATLLTACGSYKMVSHRAYAVAKKSTSAIFEDLAPTKALRTLVELERFEEDPRAVAAVGGGSSPPDIAAWEVLTARRISSLEYDLQVDMGPGVASATKKITSTGGTGPESVTEPGVYFSTLTAIAVEAGLDPTAIPGLAVGFRPNWNELGWLNDSWLESSGLGFDIFIGGAVAPGGSADGNVDLALGAGLTFPWANNGAFSIGAVTWRNEVDGEGADTEIAAFFGINLGNFQVSDNAN